MVPEAPLGQVDEGLAPAGDGWFVLNARDARWYDRGERGLVCLFEGAPGKGLHFFFAKRSRFVELRRNRSSVCLEFLAEFFFWRDELEMGRLGPGELGVRHFDPCRKCAPPPYPERGTFREGLL